MNGLQNLAQLTSSQLANCFVLGIAIAGFAAVASAAIGRRSSGVRFVLLFAALVATAFLFFFVKPITNSVSVAHVAPAISLRPEWALYIFGAWALFACIALGRVARGLWRVRALKKTCIPLESSQAAAIQGALSIPRQAQLCTSDYLQVPAALGFFRPVIALPTWAVNELSEAELNAVVLHEAAHLQRWDDWTNLLQKVIRALLFFHPAVWWIDNRLSIEREMSCDDVVLANSRSPRQYAACLVSLAEKTYAHKSLTFVQAVVGHLTHTAKRISKILDGNQRTTRPLFKPAIAATVIFGAASFVAVQRTPQLVTFRNAAQSSAHNLSADKFDYVANANGPRAKAIAASLRMPTANAAIAATAQSSPLHKSSTTRLRRNGNPTPIPLQPEEARNRFEKGTPAVVNAAMSDRVVPSFVYLVTQTEQCDGFGNVTVTTSVWRIRVMKPAPTQTQNSALPNRT